MRCTSRWTSDARAVTILECRPPWREDFGRSGRARRSPGWVHEDDQSADALLAGPEHQGSADTRTSTPPRRSTGCSLRSIPTPSASSGPKGRLPRCGGDPSGYGGAALGALHRLRCDRRRDVVGLLLGLGLERQEPAQVVLDLNSGVSCLAPEAVSLCPPVACRGRWLPKGLGTMRATGRPRLPAHRSTLTTRS